MCKKDIELTMENLPRLIESAMINQLSQECHMTREEVISHLNNLIDSGYISRTDSGAFKLNVEGK